MELAEADVAEPQSSIGIQKPDERAPIAPWQHTVAIVAVVAGMAIIAHLARSPATLAVAHIPRYLSQMMLIWMILGSVVAGIYHRRLFFFRTLEQNRVSWVREGMRGAVLYIGLMLAFGFALQASSFRSNFREIQHAKQTGEDQTQVATRLQEQTQSKLHFDSRVVRALAPSSGWELLLWLGVSLTAGFCEEHIFRGYLLTQGIAWMARTRLPRAAGIAIAVAGSSLLFGSIHVYEGAGGAVFIGFLGAAYCLVSLRYGNLRTVIVAHALQDFAAGMFLWMRHH
jgi:membrane protease YdiL (CAAX protease family)